MGGELGFRKRVDDEEKVEARWGIYENQCALNDAWNRRRKIARTEKERERERQFRRDSNGTVAGLKPLFHFRKMDSSRAALSCKMAHPLNVTYVHDSERLLTSVVSILTFEIFLSFHFSSLLRKLS